MLGIDRSLSSVETARRRTAARGVTHVAFQVADLATFETDQMFDALVGRLVLLYLPDPAATLRRLARHLRPGAIVAFQEYDRSQFSQMPAGELFMQIRGWILDAFAAAGTELDMGTKLYSTFVHAGLPPPSMIAATQIACGRAQRNTSTRWGFFAACCPSSNAPALRRRRRSASTPSPPVCAMMRSPMTA